MRRAFLTLGIVLGGLYVALHLALGSRPVQRRVLDELRQELARFGLDVDIESIEFSAFSPKIYLNRVTIRTRPGSDLPLQEPVAVDKVKIEFQPIALVYRKIVIEELTLFHPRLIHHDVGRLQRRVEQILAKRPPSGDTGFAVDVKKVGLVDALVDLAWREAPALRAPMAEGAMSENGPALSIRTPSFTAFVENSARQQQTFTVETRTFEVQRGANGLALSKAEMDIDLTKKSVRVNRLVLDGEAGLHVDVRGVSALPTKGAKGFPKATLTYDVRVPLPVLARIPELGAPKVDGVVSAEGSATVEESSYSAVGGLRYESIAVGAYRVGSGRFDYKTDGKKATLTDALLQWADGEFKSQRLEIGLHDNFPIHGELGLRDVKLEGILESVNEPEIPVVMAIDGTAKAAGTLQPLDLKVDIKSALRGLTALKDKKKPRQGENVVLDAGNGSVEGKLTFTRDKMAFVADANLLGGTTHADGFLAFFGKGARLHTHSEGVKLPKISELELGGSALIDADIDSTEPETRISGTFDVEDAEVADIVLGRTKGQIYYRNGLLSFEQLELSSSEPILARGFVDFVPAHTHYKFDVDAKRADINDVFAVFRKRPLSIPLPKGGEVAARMTIEGGHDDKGIELKASGQGKHFAWYGERWSSAPFSLVYREAGFELQRILLMKKSGGIEVRGSFRDEDSEITFASHGLRIEELEAQARAPFTGEIGGEVTVMLRKGRGLVGGRGNVKVANATFRGAKLPDSSVQLRTTDDGVEFVGGLSGEGLRGRFFRSNGKNGKGVASNSELVLTFADFDFAPVAAVLMGRDVGSLTDITATGDVSFAGDFLEWRTLSGSGTVSRLNLGLKGTPMKNREAIRIKIHGGSVQVDKFAMLGTDSQLGVEFSYTPGVSVKGSLDGKLDLQFLQPFIPGVDYGTGQVTAGVRLSGHPERYELIGNLALDDGAVRLSGLSDEFRAVKMQLSVGHDRINVDHLEAQLGGGAVSVEGDVRINRFTALVPNLKITADRAVLRTGNYLVTKLSGDFILRGSQSPYWLGGRCRILEGTLSSFTTGEQTVSTGKPSLAFDVHCESRDSLFVKTDVMNAEFRGTLHLVGNSDRIGLLGSVETVRGSVLFRDTKFALSSGTARFESAQRIAPRFNVYGRALVREERTQPPAEYEVNLNVFGTPADYKIRLTSQPALTEPDIISLLLLGFTGRGQEGNYADMGMTVVGQIPLQSKIQSELGVEIKVKSMKTQNLPTAASTGIGANADLTAPSVQIQKDITKKTKLSYSSTLDAVPIREFKIEQMLDDNLTINATAVGNPRGSSATTNQQPSQSYGVDVRYRFSFE